MQAVDPRRALGVLFLPDGTLQIFTGSGREQVDVEVMLQQAVVRAI